MAEIDGQEIDYAKKFLFLIEVGGVTRAGFQKGPSLEAEIAEDEQWEGGAIVADKSPGRVKIPAITLERGATDDDDLWNWFTEVANIVANTGLVKNKFKRDLDIVQLDRDRSTRKRWRCYRCWPSKFKAGEWDNSADGNLIESVTLSLKNFKPVK